jgi:hypothetical protein
MARDRVSEPVEHMWERRIGRDCRRVVCCLVAVLGSVLVHVVLLGRAWCGWQGKAARTARARWQWRGCALQETGRVVVVGVDGVRVVKWRDMLVKNLQEKMKRNQLAGYQDVVGTDLCSCWYATRAQMPITCSNLYTVCEK